MLRRLFGQDEQIQAFDSAAPQGLGRALAVLIRKAYPAAREVCEQIAAPEEDRDIRGDIRRTIIEGSLATLVPRFAGLSVRPVPNSIGSATHREVTFGEVILAVSHTPHPAAPLRDARFRDTLASDQTGLFAEYEEMPSTASSLFAVLVHGSPRPFALAPTFMRIVFPVVGGAHGSGINLYARYPELKPRVDRPTFGLNEPFLRPDIDLGEEGQDGTAT